MIGSSARVNGKSALPAAERPRNAVRVVALLMACSVVTVGRPVRAEGNLGALAILDAKTTLWTTGRALMPGWGLYPNGEEYAGTRSLDQYAAWGSGRLTWVAVFPTSGAYSVYVRSFRDGVLVTIDEGPPVAGGKGRAQNRQYTWEHLGQVEITKGQHHIDLQIAPQQSRNMLDAILFTTAAFDPNHDPLPPAEKSPMVRAPRRYRSDDHLLDAAGSQGFVIGAVAPDAELLNDAVPTGEQLLQTLRLWGAADQYVDGSFCVRALAATGPIGIRLQELIGPDLVRISVDEIDLRVVHLRRRSLNFWENAIRNTVLPDLLLRDDRSTMPIRGNHGGFGGGECQTEIPMHESRQIWLTIRIPAGSAPGLYQGTIELTSVSDPKRKRLLPVEIEVLPLDLKPVDGYFSIYYRSQSVDPTEKKTEATYIPLERNLAELKDQVRHGVNAAILYGGPTTLNYAKAAGMTASPVITQWPAADAFGARHVTDAKALGFPDLYFFGVDEPQGDRIEVCRKEAEWRLQNGFHMFTAINAVKAQEALKDVVDRPAFSINIFNGPDHPAVLYARSKGFVPVSYWMTATPYPLWYRSLTGLYNSRCGYLGAAPWSYQDFPDDRLFNVDDNYIHAVSYPDETGEPIPTLTWEAYRSGVDDVRYLQALDRAIATADLRGKMPNPPSRLNEALTAAREIRQSRYEAIGGRLHQYMMNLQPGDLESARRALAMATVALTSTMRRQP